MEQTIIEKAIEKVIENAIELTLIMKSLDAEGTIKIDNDDHGFDIWKSEISVLAKEFETDSGYDDDIGDYIEFIDRWGSQKLIEFYKENF